jgi:hypothetical protein
MAETRWRTDKRTVLRRIAGGYLDALRDVDAALRHGCPSDHRGYWRKAAGVADD